MERWAPVVLVDKYEYGACGNCCPCRGRSTYLCGKCCVCPFCCCALPDEVFPNAPMHIKNRKDVLGSFATGGDGKAGLMAWKLVRHDDPDWKTELYGEPHPNKFYAVEIFRNAAAADMYHSQVIFTLPGTQCCSMMTLGCRQKFVDIKTVYGEPAECEKAMTYAPALALGKNGVKAGSGVWPLRHGSEDRQPQRVGRWRARQGKAHRDVRQAPLRLVRPAVDRRRGEVRQPSSQRCVTDHVHLWAKTADGGGDAPGDAQDNPLLV